MSTFCSEKIGSCILLNLLIIHQVKTKKITTENEVWIAGLNYIDSDDFTFPFLEIRGLMLYIPVQ